MWPFKKAKTGEGWLAVLQNAQGITLAHLGGTEGGKPAIRFLKHLPQGEKSSSLADVKTHFPVKKILRTTLLAEGQYRFVQVESPSVPDEERTQALRWRLKDVVDFPPETASLGVLDIPIEPPSPGRQGNVFVAAASRDAVAKVMGDFADAKIPLDAIEIPETALRNVLAFLEDPNRGLACLALVENGAWFLITFKGELYLSRRIEVSAKALVEASEDRRQMLLERIVLELQRTLDTFDRQYSFITVSNILFATELDAPEVLTYLQENLYIPVRSLDLAKGLDISACPELSDRRLQAQSLLALGAALREAQTVLPSPPVQQA